MAGPSPHTAVPPEPQIMHGGLFSEDGVTLDDIRKIERSRQPPDSGDRVARDSLTFLSCMLGPCTSLVGWCWPGKGDRSPAVRVSLGWGELGGLGDGVGAPGGRLRDCQVPAAPGGRLGAGRASRTPARLGSCSGFQLFPP